MSFLGLTAVAVLGWLVAFILFFCLLFTRDDRDLWQSNAELFSTRLRENGKTRQHQHDQLQSAEHDLEKLLQLARKIRVKRGKKPGEG